MFEVARSPAIAGAPPKRGTRTALLCYDGFCWTGRVGLAVALDAETSQGVLYAIIVTQDPQKGKFRFLILPRIGKWTCMSDMVYYQHAAKKDTC